MEGLAEAARLIRENPQSAKAFESYEATLKAVQSRLSSVKRATSFAAWEQLAASPASLTCSSSPPRHSTGGTTSSASQSHGKHTSCGSDGSNRARTTGLRGVVSNAAQELTTSSSGDVATNRNPVVSRTVAGSKKACSETPHCQEVNCQLWLDAHSMQPASLGPVKPPRRGSRLARGMGFYKHR